MQVSFEIIDEYTAEVSFVNSSYKVSGARVSAAESHLQNNQERKSRMCQWKIRRGVSSIPLFDMATCALVSMISLISNIPPKDSARSRSSTRHCPI